MAHKPRIFISAVSSEFQQLRQLVAQVLERLGYDPVRQDIFGTEPGDLREMLRQQIDDCEGLVHIVGHGYGAEPPTVDPALGRVSYTQFEFLHARQKGKITWIIFAEEGCTRDCLLQSLDLPHDPGHPAPQSFQAERRTLQEKWRERLRADGHLRHRAASDPELELRIERLKDEFAILRRADRAWKRRVAWGLAGIAILLNVLIALGMHLSAEAAAQHTALMEQLRFFEEGSRHGLSKDKQRSWQEIRDENLAQLPALSGLSAEESRRVFEEFAAKTANNESLTPLERGRAMLADNDLDGVLAEAAANKHADSYELEILAGTAALAKFREDPSPKWNEAALAAFQRGLALSDPESEPHAYADAAGAAAAVLHELARYSEAELLMRRALIISETSLAANHPDVALRLNNLAQLLHDTYRLAEAEPLMRRALAIDEASQGPNHPDVARDLSNLARLLQATNRLAEAEPLMRRALAIKETSSGPNHPDVAAVLGNLVVLLTNRDRLAEAEPLMRRVLAIDEASYGPNHPDVAIDLHNLAWLLRETNRLAEAELLMRRALIISETSLAANHPDVALRLKVLAKLFMDRDRLAEAEPLLRRALAIHEASYGPVHIDTAGDLFELVRLLGATNRLAKAEPLMRRVVVIVNRSQQSTGRRHPDMQACLRNYRGLLKTLKLPSQEIERRLISAMETTASLSPIAQELDKLLGPVKPVDAVLAGLDTQYKAENKPPIYFLPKEEPITPHLDALLGPSKLDVPLDEPIAGHLEKLLGSTEHRAAADASQGGAN